jgi:hypothetical protein
MLVGTASELVAWTHRDLLASKTGASARTLVDSPRWNAVIAVGLDVIDLGHSAQPCQRRVILDPDKQYREPVVATDYRQAWQIRDGPFGATLFALVDYDAPFYNTPVGSGCSQADNRYPSTRD